MDKKIERVFRDRQLTPAEISSDAEVRESVAREFPAKSSGIEQQQTNSHLSLTALLKAAIRESRKSIDQIASEAQVSSELLAAFLAGQRDIRMATADKLATSLGLSVHVD
jgi:DNA-binding phage protein